MNDVQTKEPNALYEGATSAFRAYVLRYRSLRAESNGAEAAEFRSKATEELLRYMKVEKHKAQPVSRAAKELAALLPGGAPTDESALKNEDHPIRIRNDLALKTAALLIVEATALQATAEFAGPDTRPLESESKAASSRRVIAEWGEEISGATKGRNAAAMAFEQLLEGSEVADLSTREQSMARRQVVEFFANLIPSAKALQLGSGTELSA